MSAYVLARDITIPAGTPVGVNSAGTQSALFCDFATVVTPETDDHTSEWTMPLGEAIELGIVKETV